MNKPLIKNKVENYREILIAEFESWGRLAVKKLVRHLKAGCTILCGKYAGCWFGPDGSACPETVVAVGEIPVYQGKEYIRSDLNFAHFPDSLKSEMSRVWDTALADSPLLSAEYLEALQACPKAEIESIVMEAFKELNSKKGAA